MFITSFIIWSFGLSRVVNLAISATIHWAQVDRSLNGVNISSNTGLSSERHQAIIEINADL